MKITKKVLAALSIVTVAVLFSCGSTKKAVDAANVESEVLTDGAAVEQTDEAIVGEAEVEQTGVVATDVAAVEETDSKKKNTEDSVITEIGELPDDLVLTGEDKKKSRKKNYTGWIDASGRDLDYRNGIIRIRAKPRLGTYNLLVLTENGKYVPVLSSSNEYTSSAYYLRADKKIFKLLNDASTKTMARKTETGIKLFYRVVNVADVEITFDTFSSKEKGDADMIKVTAEITNRGPKKAAFSLKTILDTVLGEATQYHFYTSEEFPVKSEVMYRTTQYEKWFVSQNNKAKFQVFLNGLDVSKIDSVALANYTTLDIKNWEPDMLSYRAFDTVLSYNNSAIGIFWPEKKLAVDEKVTFVYYLGFAADANKLECEKYIFPYGIPDEDEVSEVVLPAVEQNVVPEKVETVTPVETAPAQVSEVPQPDVAKNNEVEKASAPEVPRIVPNVKFDISKLTKEQLSPEYIQNLLDRIAALEENDSSLNREELLQLNAELDAILEVLRQ